MAKCSCLLPNEPFTVTNAKQPDPADLQQSFNIHIKHFEGAPLWSDLNDVYNSYRPT